MKLFDSRKFKSMGDIGNGASIVLQTRKLERYKIRVKGSVYNGKNKKTLH